MSLLESLNPAPFPGWLVLQIGVWVVLIWSWHQASSTPTGASLQWRWGTLSLSLIYIGLLLVALTAQPEGGRDWRTLSLGALAIAGVIVRLGLRSPFQACWAEATTALLLAALFANQGANIAALMIALTGLIVLILSVRRAAAQRTFPKETPLQLAAHEGALPPWLAPVTTLLFGIALIGALHFAATVESQRRGVSRRLSAFPTVQVRSTRQPDWLTGDDEAATANRQRVQGWGLLLALLATGLILGSRTQVERTPEGIHINAPGR